MENDGSKNWKKISEKLFASRSEPVSEAFAQSVMNRIKAAESGPRLVRIPEQWFAPVMGLAAMLMLALLPARGLMSMETVILGGDPEGTFLELGNGTPGTDEMLGFVMEAK